MLTPDNVIPCEGHWFADAPFPTNLSREFFDLSDLGTYPVELDVHTRMRIQNHLSYCKPTWVSTKCFSPQDRYQYERILECLRDCVGGGIQRKNVPLSREPLHREDRYFHRNLSSEEKRKRRFFLRVAKTVVEGPEAASTVAKRFQISKINVTIWVAIYLAHGPKAFEESEYRYSEDKERLILAEHLGLHRPIAYTCGCYRIFTHHRFRNMLRRYRRYRQSIQAPSDTEVF